MSAIGPKRTCASALHKSAFGDKADIAEFGRQSPVATQTCWIHRCRRTALCHQQRWCRRDAERVGGAYMTKSNEPSDLVLRLPDARVRATRYVGPRYLFSEKSKAREAYRPGSIPDQRFHCQDEKRDQRSRPSSDPCPRVLTSTP